MKIPFTKMQGLGNDFILLDNRKGAYKNLSKLSRRLCDRKLGIGADQLLLLCYSGRADFRMRIFNADGSEVEMCGNGIRCLAKYIWDNKLGTGNSLILKQKQALYPENQS
jgi:diaminopimelate epimerase